MIESSGLFGEIVVIAIGAVIAIAGALICDYPCRFHPVIQKYRGKIGMLILIAGIFVIIYAMLFAPDVGKGEIGLDENGNWYGEGTHIIMPFSITFIPLKDSIAYSNNLELQYNLTREEVILIGRGRYFPEYLREEIWIVYGEDGVALRNVPEGIDPSHLKVMIGFNPPFYFSHDSSQPNSQ